MDASLSSPDVELSEEMLQELLCSAQISHLISRNTLRASPQQQWLLKAPLFCDVSPYESKDIFKEHSAWLWSTHAQALSVRQVCMVCEHRGLKLEQRADYLSLAVSCIISQ